MIRVKKENHRSWFMSNYYPCEYIDIKFGEK